MSSGGKAKDPVGEVTALLQAWSSGDIAAGDRLFDLVYPELRRLAERRLAGEGSNVSIQATDLVHEAYLRLVDQRQAGWQNRAQFYALAATVLRRVLVDRARRRQRKKRGAGAIHLTLDRADGRPGFDFDLLALDEALGELAAVRVTAARIVELRFFAGLSLDETAQVMRVSRSSVVRRWRFAKAWLARRLKGSR